MSGRSVRPRDQIATLRAEAHFALLCGAILLGLGVGISLVFLVVEADWLFLGPALAAPPLLVGWLLWQYAAGRLAFARRIEDGVMPAPSIRAKVAAAMKTFRQRQGQA